MKALALNACRGGFETRPYRHYGLRLAVAAAVVVQAAGGTWAAAPTAKPKSASTVQGQPKAPPAAPAVPASPSPKPPPAPKVTPAQAQANPLAVLQTFTVGDLQTALADAQAQTPPDTTSALCYTALIPIVAAGVNNPLPAGLGVFQALQKARDAKALLANIQSPNGPLAALNIACAPLVLDAQNTLIQLGIVAGTVAATGGLALPALPALPFTLPFTLP
jgi:hypothetical protein